MMILNFHHSSSLLAPLFQRFNAVSLVNPCLMVRSECSLSVAGLFRNYSPIAEALDVIDRWILSIKKRPENGVVKNRPSDASDMCFDKDGVVIASGMDVWNRASGSQPTGECRKKYPVYSNSRQVAGAPLSDSIFKCTLQSIDTALNEGLYGQLTTDVLERLRVMKRVFPSGICDYTAPDVGRPKEILVDKHVPVTIAGRLIEPDYRDSREIAAENESNEEP
ncbi:hypothetical protein JF535_12110 [Microbulbifer salipaludis]|uniref:DUF6351 domain-containing protein n=3 Tax=Microbulbifer TaxID=48073 RepID=A0ABS3E8F0_9GAMM|nr:hypothetical protein [Microbulbifer salipaludis]